MEEKFNSSIYINSFIKEHYKRSSINLKKDLYKKWLYYLKKDNMTKNGFVKEAIEKYIEEKEKQEGE